jgi:hypothetical protein
MSYVVWTEGKDEDEEGVEGDDPEDVLEEDEAAIEAKESLPGELLCSAVPLHRVPLVPFSSLSRQVSLLGWVQDLRCSWFLWHSCCFSILLTSFSHILICMTITFKSSLLRRSRNCPIILKATFRFQPDRPSSMQNLFPQPYKADESQQGEGDNGTALEDVRHDVLRAEHVDGEAEDGRHAASEESSVDPTGCEWDDPKPSNCDKGVVKPELDGPAHRAHQAGEDEAEGDPLGHVRGVDGGERESVVAQLAELFLAVPEPLDETVLVDKLDGSGADARVEERSL